MVTHNDDKEIEGHSKMSCYNLPSAEFFAADPGKQITPGTKPHSTILYNTFNP